MLKFDEQAQIESVNGALALRYQINTIIDSVSEKGYKNLCWLGIGGTYASCQQVQVHMAGRTEIESFVENAAEYCVTGNRRIGPDTLIVISSVTGSTEEMVRGVRKAQEAGAKVLGFIDVDTTELAQLVDYEIAYPMHEQLKFYMVADRLMHLRGEFPAYERYYAEMDQHLGKALASVEVQAEAFGVAFAEQHKDDILHYFIGAGNQWGATYSYAMCYWEEQHWIRTKSIHAAEFFHGTLEVVDRDTAVTVFVGEDSQRDLSLRVAKFLPRVCGNYTIIDTADYQLEGISLEFRGSLSHLVMRAITKRIDVHIERLNCHPMEIRRYYRRLEY